MDALPRSRMGRLACWFQVAFLAWWFLNLVVVQVVQRVDTSDYRWALIGFGWLGLSMGLVGGVLAIVALSRFRDRTVLVWLCLVPMAFVVVFVLGELLVPH